MTRWFWVYAAATGTLLFNGIPHQLRKFGYDPVIGNEYVYAEGNIPLLITAHVDTVHYGGLDDLYFDRKKRVIWSPQGVGGDDRAGVSLILEMLYRGYKPHVLFLDKEESGGQGARAAVKELGIPNVRYLVGLDRKGRGEAVFYSCGNTDFIEYIQAFGFKEHMGSFSDISILCPKWGVAGVNLSVGYYRNHTNSEYVKIDDWLYTANKLSTMMRDLPESAFDYQGAKTSIVRRYNTNVRSSGYSHWSNGYGGSGNRNNFQGGTWKGHVPSTPALPKSVSKIPEVVETEIEEETINGNGISLDVIVYYDELIEMYGGTEEEWAAWINNNRNELINELQGEAHKNLEEMLLYDATSPIFTADER